MAWIQDTYSKTLGHGGLDAIGMQQTFFMVFSEMKITKNKNLKARLYCRFSIDLNPYPSLWIFFIGYHKNLAKVSRLLVRRFYS
jgi:hypothetical protein